MGHTLHAEADLDVDPDLTLAQSHRIAYHAEAHLVTHVQGLTGATIHTSPAGNHSTPGQVEGGSRAKGIDLR